MIDVDICHNEPVIEEFLKSLKVKFRKDYSPIKIYISTANPYNHWSQKLYNFYDKKEEQNG